MFHPALMFVSYIKKIGTISKIHAKYQASRISNSSWSISLRKLVNELLRMVLWVSEVLPAAAIISDFLKRGLYSHRRFLLFSLGLIRW